MSKPANNTYGQILKSSVLIGGSSFFVMGFNAVRAKAMALMLGTAGVGLLDLYWHISELSRTVASLGINNSGVRQIAEAVGTNDNHRIARTVTTLRRLALALGIIGALLLVALCVPVSRFAFKDSDHAKPVALLAVAVFFGAITASQVALVQGMRRIADLARINVIGAFFGTVFSIPIVFLFREQGVVPSLICVAGMSIITSWWFSRKIKVERVALKSDELRQEASNLLKLGIVFMSTILMTIGTALLTRVIIKRQLGDDALGLYAAAWSLSGMYVMFILQAMGTDFYPRLTAASRDVSETNRLVNEQTEVSLLLAAPGVMATLAFAPLLVVFFYSAKFNESVEVLRWNCLGMLLRVASWPMAFVFLARGERGLYFWTELFSNTLHVGLVWWLTAKAGVNGGGMAFAALYLCYWVMVYFILRKLCGFRWSAANKRIGSLMLPLFGIVFASWYLLPPLAASSLGAITAVVLGFLSLKNLCALVSLEKLPQIVRKLAAFLRLVPSGNNA